MAKHHELSRFSASGKTFFFNKGVAKNDSPYLTINALYGRGNQERLILFEPHWVQFKRHMEEAIASLTGFVIVPKKEEPTKSGSLTTPITLATRCPSCGFGGGKWRVLVIVEQLGDTEGYLDVTCECGQLIYTGKSND